MSESCENQEKDVTLNTEKADNAATADAAPEAQTETTENIPVEAAEATTAVDNTQNAIEQEQQAKPQQLLIVLLMNLFKKIKI